MNNFLYNLQKLVCQIIVCFALQCSTVVKKIVPFWLELKVMRTFVRKMMRYFLWLQHFVHDLDLTLHCLLKVAKFSSGMIIKSMSRAAVAKRTKAANFSRTGSGFEPCIYRFRKDFNPFWYGTQNRLIQYKCLKSRRAGPTYCMDGPKTYKR